MTAIQPLLVQVCGARTWVETPKQNQRPFAGLCEVQQRVGNIVTTGR